MNRTLALAAMLLAAPIGTAPAYATEAPGARPDEVPTAMAFLTALGRLNFDSAGLFLDDEAILGLPFAGKGMVVKGRKPVLNFFRKSMSASIESIQYRMDHAYLGRDADSVVMEITTQGRTKAGRDYTNRLVAVFEFRNGKILLFREYFNPIPLG